MTMPNDVLSLPPQAERDANGRFAKGNLFGQGNPFARRVAALRSALLEEVDETKFRQMVRDLVTMALQKDLAAIKLVFHYVLGKPTAMVNPDDLDRLEWEQLKRDSLSIDELQQQMAGTVAPIEMGNTLIKAAVPCNGANIGKYGAHVLRTGNPYGDDDEASQETPASEQVEPEMEDDADEEAPAPLVALPVSTVTARGQRSDRAANAGQSKPIRRANKKRNKKRRGKGRS